MAGPDRADVVVVGAGTIGGWAATFLAEDGAGRVVVLERGLAGRGRSSRAAGIVRAQGGTPATVALGRWTIDFYNGQAARYGTDSGFRELGYLIIAITARDERDGRVRVAMQRAEGLRGPLAQRGRGLRQPDAQPGRATAAGATSRPTARSTRRATSGPTRWRCSGPVSSCASGPRLTGVRIERRPGRRRRHHGGADRHGTRPADRWTDPARGRTAGRPRIPAGAVRHQVAVTEPHPAFDVDRLPMVFDLGPGLYWRLEEGGLLFGMSNPVEPPGPAREIDWPYLRRMRRRLDALVPATARPRPPPGLGGDDRLHARPPADPRPGDHAGRRADRRPVGRLAGRSRDDVGTGRRRASPPTSSLHGRSELIDVTDLGLDRFDAEGRSRLATDPIALPFPVAAGD